MKGVKYIKDAAKIKSSLVRMPDKRVVATQPIKIYSPTRYVEKNLATIGIDVYILGIFAWVVEDRFFAVNLVNAMVPITPTQTNRIKIEGDEFFEFVFNKGDTVIKTVDLVCTDTITYQIYNDIIARGNIPWYLGYEELRKIFDSAKKHADANIGTQQEVTALVVSRIARSRQDKTRDYRTVIQKTSDLVTNPPVFIPLMSVRLGATNTLTKLGGSYFGQGLNSALLHPSQRPERIESILLK